MDGIENVEGTINENSSRLLWGGNQANYYLDLKIFSNNGEYYFDTPNKPVKIDGTGTNVTFPDGRIYTVQKIDSNGITYTDPRTNQTVTETVSQAQEKFRQFEVVDDTHVKFRGKTYEIGDTIWGYETGNNGDKNVQELGRDIKLVKAENGELTYKTTWGVGMSYHEDQFRDEALGYATGDRHEFTTSMERTSADAPSQDDPQQSGPNGAPTGPGATPPGTTAPQKPNDEYTTRADDYKTVNKLDNDEFHGYGSKDVGDVGDQDRAITDFDTYFHDERVQNKFNEINGGSPTIHEGEGISHHHHQTMTDNYEYNGTQVTYLPGQAIALAGDPTRLSTVTPLMEMTQQNIGNNVLGEGFNPPANGKWSKIEYAAALASSGKYSMQDLFGTANALGDDNFEMYKGPYFQGTMLEKTADLIDETGKSAEKMQEELTNDVNELAEGWKEIHELLEGMSGEAKDAAEFYTIQCVQGKFEVAMGNIEDRLKPACLAISLLYTTSNINNITGIDGVKIPSPPAGLENELEGINPDAPLLRKLQEGEKLVNNYLGEGDNNKNPNLKKVIEKMNILKDQIDGIKLTIHYLGARPSDQPEKDSAGKDIEGTNANASAQQAWDVRKLELDKKLADYQKEYEELDKTKTELEAKIKEMRATLNGILEYSMILYDFVKKYETYRGTYRKYVLGQGVQSGELNIYDLIKSGDINALVSNHDAIINAFEDYDKMPVISNKSDYNPGDVVLYDDAHGYIYVVKGYDPLTGELIIACYDQNGNQVGSDITVWDQREIAPITGIQAINPEEYASIPPTYIISTTGPVSGTTNPPARGTTAPPSHGTTAPPTPSTTKPPTPSTTKPPTPSTTKPPVPPAPTTRPPEPVPSIPIYTIPETNGPDSPHTGLDAIYGTGETKQSATGLGALAGLAAGAAGLGLTGLIGDKKEDEEEEDDKDYQVAEEKPAYDFNEHQEEQQNDNNSNPQFF